MYVEGDLYVATIYQNMDLGVLEIRIGEELGNCTIWGDLNLSGEEYEVLNNKVIGYLSDKINSNIGLVELIYKYPKVMVTHIINFTLFEYDGNHFWVPWSEKFNTSLDSASQSKIGTLILSVLKKYGFNRWEEDGLKYITPIICQAGIPTPSYDEIFDILEGTLNDFYFSPSELLSEINSGKHYHIEKGPERFFRLYPEKSIDLFNSIRIMLQTLDDQTISLEKAVTIYSDIPPRIVERYLNRLNEDKCSNSERRKKIHYAPPRLDYSDDGKGVSIILPEQTIRDEYIYKTTWKIYKDESYDPIYCNTQPVLIAERSSYINANKAAVDLANEYKVELWGDSNEEQPIRTWKIDGLKDNPYLLFDSSGRIVKNDTLSFNGITSIILAPGTKTTLINDVALYPIDLPMGWAKLKAFTAVPLEKEGYLVLNNEINTYRLSVKYSYDIKLFSTGNLFREEYPEKSVPVYTRWPAFQIGSKEDTIEDIENWEIRLRSFNTGEQVSAHNRDFSNELDGYFELEKLTTYFEKSNSGKYELKVYRGREFKKSFLFYKAPYIESNDSIKREWPSKFSNIELTGFRVLDNPGEYELEIDTNVKIEKHLENHRSWNHIMTYDTGTKINGVLKVKENQSVIEVPFQKTVRKMKWGFWNEISNDEIHCKGTKAFDLDELWQGRWWITLHLSGKIAQDSILELVLQTRNRQPLQIFTVKLNDSGNFSLPMGGIQSTIENYKPPLSLMFHFIDGESGDERWICLSQIKDRTVLKNIKYQITKNDRAVIIWDETDRIDAESLQIISLTNPNYNANINLKDIRTNDYHRQYVLLENKLPAGIYVVSPYEQMDDFLIDDNDTRYSLFDYAADKIIRVDAGSFTPDNAKSLYDWLDLAVIHLNNATNLGVVEKRMKIKNCDISFKERFEDAGKILFSLIINIKTEAFAEEIRIILNSILENIFVNLFGNNERGRLIPLMMRCKLGQDEKETLISEIGLHRFSVINDLLSGEEIRDLWDVDRLIAALWIMKSKSIDSSNAERIINLVGTDFFQEATVLTSENPDEADWYYTLKEVVMGTNPDVKVFIKSTKDIWGDTQELIDMIDFGNRPGSKIIMDYKKRSTKGKLFAGSRYLDLLIEWYRDTAFNEDINSEIKKTALLASEAEKKIIIPKNVEKIGRELFDVLENRKANETPRYKMCYYSALFALMEAFLKDNEDYNYLSVDTNDFARKVFHLNPSLYKRDLLMAELYAILIKGRGAVICQ